MDVDTTVSAWDIAIPPGHGMMHEFRADVGDVRAMWDRNSETEVAAAREIYDRLTRQGYRAYRARGKHGGDQGALLDEFDPAAERIILTPRLAGG